MFTAVINDHNGEMSGKWAVMETGEDTILFKCGFNCSHLSGKVFILLHLLCQKYEVEREVRTLAPTPPPHSVEWVWKVTEMVDRVPWESDIRKMWGVGVSTSI